MPNIHVGTINSSGPTNALVGTSSAIAVAAVINRVGLILTNVSSGTVFLGLQNTTATLNAGIVLTPNGGTWSMDEYSFTNDQINAVAYNAGSVMCIQEFIR